MSGSAQNNVNVRNDVGPLALTITGSTFNNNSLGFGGFATGPSTLDLTVNGSNAFTSNGDGIGLGNNGGGTLTFDVMGNGFTGNSFAAVNLSGSGPGGVLRGSITGNTISGGPLFSRGIEVTANRATTLCTNIRSNTISVGDANSIELRQNGTSTVSIEGLNGGTGSVSVPTDVASFLESVNPSTFASVSIATSIRGVPLGTCRTP